MKKSIQVSQEQDADILFGPIFSSDCFYDPRNDDERWTDWVKQGILAVEMESQILYWKFVLAILPSEPVIL